MAGAAVMPRAVDLDAAPRQRATRAIQRMVEFAPSTGGLALWVKHRDIDGELPAADGARPPAVVTDGDSLIYGASFDRLPVAEQAGLVAHEVLHIALRHVQRFVQLNQRQGDADLELYNICADAIVNSTLAHVSWLTLSPSAVLLEQLLRRVLHLDEGVEASLLEWDVERLYRAVDDRRDGRESGTRARATGSRRREDGPRAAQVRALGAGTPSDLVLPVGQGAPLDEALAMRTWSERLLRAHAGDGLHSMLRLIGDLPRHRTPWEQVLRMQLARSLAPKPDISWSRPARSYIANQGRLGKHGRLPWTPGIRSSKNVLKLAVIVDVSGSIDGNLLQRFCGEIEAITRRLEAAMVLIIGDDQVRRVERFEAGHAVLPRIEFRGGGGTDFTPLLEEAERHRPDIAVVLTDLDGPARRRPRCPVIWAVPEAHARHAHPFGRKLILS